MAGLLSFLKRFRRDTTPPEYRVFTRDHDQVLRGDDVERFLESLPDIKAEWALAPQAVDAEIDAWKGNLGSEAAAMSREVERTVPLEARRAMVVSILVDHSGSMRGLPIRAAAAATDLLQRVLLDLEYRTEVLGFTTSSWKGGRSRQRWLASGRPRNPGRLCDLLHIVYRSAEDHPPWHSAALAPMLDPRVLKENVDGEALLWATARLDGLIAQRRILVVVSDGAPVDDSTLACNDLAILDRHLRGAIREIEASETIELAAVGIGQDVGRYYAVSATVLSPNDLGRTLLDLVRTLLVEAPAT